MSVLIRQGLGSSVATWLLGGFSIAEVSLEWTPPDEASVMPPAVARGLSGSAVLRVDQDGPIPRGIFGVAVPR